MKTIDDIKNETNVPAVVADEKGLIIRINKPFETLFGWTSKEIIGMPLVSIIPEHLHHAHNLGFSRFLVSGKPTLLNQPLKLKAIKKDGEEFDAEHYIVAEKEHDGWIFGALIKPLN